MVGAGSFLQSRPTETCQPTLWILVWLSHSYCLWLYGRDILTVILVLVTLLGAVVSTIYMLLQFTVLYSEATLRYHACNLMPLSQNISTKPTKTLHSCFMNEDFKLKSYSINYFQPFTILNLETFSSKKWLMSNFLTKTFQF